MAKGSDDKLSSDFQILEKEKIQIAASTEDSSNLCVAKNSGDQVLVGTEIGCYVLALTQEKVISTCRTEDGKTLEEVPSAIFNSEDENVILVATNSTVLMYDMRDNSKPIFTFKDNQEEVNQLSLTGKHLAACDDSGEVKIFDLSAKKLFRTLRNKHSNICSTVCYRKNVSQELLSGSLDCQLILWDYSKIKVLHASNIQDIFRAIDGENSNYMCNPPLINAVDCTEDGSIIAGGLGNGCIVLYDIAKGRKLRPFDILRHHSSLGTSCLQFFGFKDSRFLISGGNDCKLNVKEISANCSKQTNDISASSSIQMTSKLHHLTAFTQNDKLFTLVCDQSNQLSLLEVDFAQG